jgi:sugar phosphate isomerase/epimerase
MNTAWAALENAHTLSRRRFLGASLGAAGAVALGGAWATSARGGNGLLVPPGKRSIILFTVRDAISRDPTTSDLPSGFLEVLEHLSQIGYKGIEFAGFTQNANAEGGRTPAAETLRGWLEAFGLTGVGNHGSIPSTITPTTLAAFDAALEFANGVGLKFIGTGGDPTGSNFKADWDAAAERWNILGERAAAAGLKLYTHNHDAAYNFLLDSGPLDALGRPTRSSGIRKLEYFLQVTNPEYVHLEMDIYWAHVAQHRFFTYTAPDGSTQENVFDPGALVAANTKRYPLFHAKDGARTGEPPGVGSGYTFVPLGQGDIDFTMFFANMGSTGFHYPMYEQDNAPGGAADPGRSLRFAAESYAAMDALRA